MPTSRHPRARKRAPLSASVAVNGGEAGVPVASGFLGLSFEAGSLAQLASYGGEGDLVALLRSLGPGVLRFGGVTADHQVAWSEGGDPRPPWASRVLEAADFARLAQLAAASDWRVLLTLNLGHYEPSAAAEEAAAAKAQLGPWLQAIELGNEPDGYVIQRAREEPWTFLQYDEQVAAYRAAIEAAAPGLPLAGPDVYSASSFGTWGVGEAIDQAPALLTGHHYPLGCAEVPPPSIPRLLSPLTREGDLWALGHYVHVSEVSEIPFRMDETNSVSCGGVPGISNTFASSLWAVSYIARAMTLGIAGINLQGNPSNCGGYTPLCAPTPEDLASGHLEARPEWYALLLLRGLVGERPVSTALTAPASTNLTATSFLAPGGALHIVFVDDDPPGTRKLSLHLEVGSAFSRASVLALTAPSPAALSGVRLGGREVASDGSFTPPTHVPVYPQRHGVITVQLAPSSAALISVSR